MNLRLVSSPWHCGIAQQTTFKEEQKVPRCHLTELRLCMLPVASLRPCCLALCEYTDEFSNKASLYPEGASYPCRDIVAFYAKASDEQLDLMPFYQGARPGRFSHMCTWVFPEYIPC